MKAMICIPRPLKNIVLVANYIEQHGLPSAFPQDFVVTEFDDSQSLSDREMLLAKGVPRLKGASHQVWSWQEELASPLLVFGFTLLFTDFFIRDRTG